MGGKGAGENIKLDATLYTSGPICSGEKRGYGFVDFIEDSSTKKALAAAHERQNRSTQFIFSVENCMVIKLKI